ncbi:hypothetical protein [Neobacillus sp. YIM B06451]|uniref:hypothetical protein n=1 Tax=Neobacillus sp. YIM B06451 TaxID=3070994 RepID=UPI0029303886|nr:hypothetical protein [Neobacillus sp. YIM B06451]
MTSQTSNLDLQGLWAAGIFYYDTFEETYIGLSDQGLGFIYYMNPASDYIELFKWEITGQDEISIFVNKTYTFYDEELSEMEDSCERIENIRVKKYKKMSFTEEMLETIEFSQPLFLNDSVFGLDEEDIRTCHKYRRLKKLIGENLPNEFKYL